MFTIILYIVAIIIAIPLILIGGLLALFIYWREVASVPFPDETSNYKVLQLLGPSPSLLSKIGFYLTGVIWPLSTDPRGNGVLHLEWQRDAQAQGLHVGMTFYGPGRTMAMIYHPDDIAAVFADSTGKIIKHDQYESILGSILGLSGLVTERDEPTHTITRSIAGPAFAPRMLRNYATHAIPLMGANLLKEVSAAVDEAASKGTEKDGFDLDPPLMHFSLRTGLQTIFNTTRDKASTGGMDIERWGSTLLANISDVSLEMLLPAWLKPWVPTPRYVAIESAKKEIAVIATHMFNESSVKVQRWREEYFKKNPGAIDDPSEYLPDEAGVVDFFVAAEPKRRDLAVVKKVGGYDAYTRENAVTLLGAATDTTQRALLWALIALADDHSAQKKLVEELEDIVQAGVQPELEELTPEGAPFLNAVVNEVLRYRSPVPIVGRMCSVDFKLPRSGVTLKKGTQFGVLMNNLHRDTAFWKDADGKMPVDDFHPERWLLPGGPTTCPLEKVFMPFLPKSHKRNCIGSGLALQEFKTQLAALVATFEFSMPPGKKAKDIKLDWAITLRPSEPVPLVVRRRAK